MSRIDRKTWMRLRGEFVPYASCMQSTRWIQSAPWLQIEMRSDRRQCGMSC